MRETPTREKFQIYQLPRRPAKEIKWREHSRVQVQALALMIITSVDWKRVGLAAGSKIDALDWNDWNSPLISRLNAKLLRKRTCVRFQRWRSQLNCDPQLTRLDIAVLNKTRRVSS